MLKIFLAIFTIWLFSGCSPKYQITQEYIAPSEQEAKTCIKSCYLQMRECEDACKIRFENCKNKAQKVGQENYQKKMKEYVHNLEKYADDLREYEQRYEHCEDRREDYYNLLEISCKGDSKCIKKGLFNRRVPFCRFDNDSFIEPIKPRKPDLQMEIDRATNKLCQVDCNCQKNYDKCYVSCGGEIITKKECIENCKEDNLTVK